MNKDRFYEKARELGIAQDKADALWGSIEDKKETAFEKWAYFFLIGIMVFSQYWLSSVVNKEYGYQGLWIVSIIYGLLYFLLGWRLWKSNKTPSGLFLTAAVFTVPMIIYGLGIQINLWPALGTYVTPMDLTNHEHNMGIILSAGTILAGLGVIQLFPYPMITLPIFWAALFLVHDIATRFTEISHDVFAVLSGLALLLISFFIQHKKGRDYAFWGYLTGLFPFSFGLLSLFWGNHAGMFVIFLTSVGLMIASLYLNQKVFMVFGTAGTFVYLMYLAEVIFKDSLFMPVFLAFLCLVFVGFLIWVNKHYEQIKGWFGK